MLGGTDVGGADVEGADVGGGGCWGDCTVVIETVKYADVPHAGSTDGRFLPPAPGLPDPPSTPPLLVQLRSARRPRRRPARTMSLLRAADVVLHPLCWATVAPLTSFGSAHHLVAFRLGSSRMMEAAGSSCFILSGVMLAFCMRKLTSGMLEQIFPIFIFLKEE